MSGEWLVLDLDTKAVYYLSSPFMTRAMNEAEARELYVQSAPGAGQNLELVELRPARSSPVQELTMFRERIK